MFKVFCKGLAGSCRSNMMNIKQTKLYASVGFKLGSFELKASTLTTSTTTPITEFVSQLGLYSYLSPSTEEHHDHCDHVKTKLNDFSFLG